MSGRWPIVARYVVVGLLAVVCLLIYLNETFANEIAQKTSEELFLAFAVAILISLIIDVPTRQELREDIKHEINENLKAINSTADEIKQHSIDVEARAYKTAFAGQIPVDFLNTIQTKAFKGPFLRETLRATWHFEIQDGNRLFAHVDNTSVLKNVTDSVQIYPPKFYFDERQGVPKILRISIDGVPIDVGQLKILRASELEPDLVLNLPTKEIQPHGQIEVMSDFIFERSWTDWELYTTLYPCHAMSLRVLYPDKNLCTKEYFKVDQLGGLFFRRHDHETYVDIDVQDKILPDQGLLFAWRFLPKKTA